MFEFQQTVQTAGEKEIQNKGESSHHTSHRKTVDPERSYSYSFLFTGGKQTRFPSGFTPLIDQESKFFTIAGRFLESTKIEWQEQDFFQTEEGRVR
ncbi:hypothetical protein O181_006817 [Austropuccinia psidii MF-1]|uniref:Uncharacterized protein n=1 Tax=Austropuccinia psidii MF-1 TaxID=1389203 RepID=A0A9Q3BLI2_9BASI|nr:hypothetical protein [Austropuccinia psidii MF-1]